MVLHRVAASYEEDEEEGAEWAGQAGEGAVEGTEPALAFAQEAGEAGGLGLFGFVTALDTTPEEALGRGALLMKAVALASREFQAMRSELEDGRAAWCNGSLKL